MDLEASIAAAWTRRGSLHDDVDTDAYRLFHGWGEGCPGLSIDRYGAAAALCYRAHLSDHVPAAVAALDACHRFEAVVLRPHGGRPRWLRPPAGESQADPTAPWVVREHGLRFELDLLRPGNPGLYLDARPARRWLRAHSHGRRVVNLFAFTGSLGVAAAAGGARVVHVDSARSALDGCRRNHALNQLAVDERDLARLNVYQHLRRQSGLRRQADGVIIDPPPLSGRALRSDRTPGGRGVLGLAPLAARMLAPGGWLLCLFHHQPHPHDDLEQAVIEAAEVSLQVVWRDTSGPDFAEPDPLRCLRMSVFSRAT
ncbi:class I SAM-dependent methyltransferase [Haliangium sp.]|uniref:class I SAM-dependent methyltransferase n=1 Tax=Haliangium sp. TaxID=2663208 RepID=UPI003D13E499